MKIFYRLFLLLCLPFLLSSCDFKDIDKRFFVVTIGFDQGTIDPERIAVSFKCAIPTGAPKMGQEEFQTFTVESDSITEAMQKIKTHVDKELDFGHSKVVLIGEALTKRNINQIVDWLTRERFIQEVSFLAVGKPTAKDVLEIRPRFERLPSNALFLSFGGTGVESQFITNVPLFEFYRNFYEPGIDPLLPVVVASKDHHTMDHDVIFKHGKLKATLTDTETRLYNLLTKEVGHADLKFPMQDMIYGVHLDSFDPKFSMDSSEQNAVIHLKVKMRGILEERSKPATATKETMLKIEETISKKMTQETMDFLTSMQKQELDPLGFGMMYRAKQWQPFQTEVKNWLKIYPKATFTVQYEVKLESTGTIR